MRIITLLFCCSVALFVQAQDFVIGGQAKPSASTEKYDSLSNFCHDKEKVRMMIGQEFTYYNIYDYSKGMFQPPYPWKDGRLRSGRYTSSQAAMDAYLAELKKKSGTKYALTDIVTYEGRMGYVFTDSKGESIFYTNLDFVDGEFICEGYKEKFRKTYVGKEVFFTTKDWNPAKLAEQSTRPVIDIMKCFIGLQSRELRPSFPQSSKWMVKGLGVDTTYWGNHTRINDMDNGFCRLVFVIHNDELGDYECYVHNSGMLDKKLSSPKFILPSMFSGKLTSWGKVFSTGSWAGFIPKDVLSLAKDGDPNAMYAIIDYYYRQRNVNNFTFEEYVGLLNSAVDVGYIDYGTPKYLYGVAKQYIPYNLESDLSDKNNYEKATPFLVKAINYGNSQALKTLLECIEKGKINNKEAYQTVENLVEKETSACLFLGHQLLKGEKVGNSERIVLSLLQIADKNPNEEDRTEALLILSECYKKGIGVSKDANKRIDMLTKAADGGSMKACLELGEAYYLGEGVSKDLDKATKYLEKGANMVTGNISNVDFKYYIILGKLLASKSDSKCITYLRKALYGDSPERYEAAIELGKIYYEGRVVEKSEGEAAEYFWTAFKEGKIEEGRQLFEKYQLKDTLIKLLKEKESQNLRKEVYVNDMIESLSLQTR